MQRRSCQNLNHRRTNAPVYACPVCGEVVNRYIPIKNCSEEEHAKRRKDISKYCVDCSKQLIQ